MTNAEIIKAYKDGFAKKGGRAEAQFNYLLEVWNTMTSDMKSNFKNDFGRYMEVWMERLVMRAQKVA